MRAHNTTIIGTINVLHVMSSFPKGGRERQLVTLYKYTDKKKFNTIIAYLYDLPDDYLKDYGITKNIYRIKSKNFFFRIIELHKIIKKKV